MPLLYQKLILREQLRMGRIVVWPMDGIGTGLSQLSDNAPKVWESLENARKELEAV